MRKGLERKINKWSRTDGVVCIRKVRIEVEKEVVRER